MNRFSLFFLISIICIWITSCSDDGVNNPLSNSELKILKTLPVTGTSLESANSIFSIQFDNLIYQGNLSIRLFDYSNNNLIEKIPLTNIQIKDSTINFPISQKLKFNSKYYILIDSGAVSFSSQKNVYKGFIDKNVWSFIYTGIELNIEATYPVNNSKLADFKTPFKITFDNKISAGNLSIKIIDYDKLNVVETINTSNIILSDSSIKFTITNKLESEKRYSILIDSGAIKFSDNNLSYHGFKSKTIWSFYSPRILLETNIMRATISGAYSYQFEEKGSNVRFIFYSSLDSTVLAGATNHANNHELILNFKLVKGKDNIYSLISAELPSSYTVSLTEDYLSNSAGTIKVLANTNEYFEGEFNFTGKSANNSKTVTVSNGYIFVYKK